MQEGEQPAESAVDCKPTAAEQTPASQAVITVPMPLSRRATAKEPLPAAGIWAYAPSLARWAQKEPVDTDLNMYRPADSITGPAAEPQQQPTAEPQQQPKAEPQHAGVASQAVLLPHAQNKSEILSVRSCTSGSHSIPMRGHSIDNVLVCKANCTGTAAT